MRTEDCVNKLQTHNVILNYEGKQLVCRKPEGDPAAITYGRGLTQLLQGETGLTEATSDHLQPKEGLRDFHGHVRFEILALVYSVIPPFSHSFSHSPHSPSALRSSLSLSSILFLTSALLLPLSMK